MTREQSPPQAPHRMALGTEAVALWRKYAHGLEAQAAHDHELHRLLLDRAREHLGLDPAGPLDVLDLGCGQLYPHAFLAAATGHRVQAVDAGVVLATWSPLRVAELFLRDGPVRGAKTVTRRALFDRRYHDALVRRAGCAPAHPPRFARGDAARLPLADASIDLAVSVSVLEHLDDVAAALAEVRRVLRPGGALAFVIHPFAGPTGGHASFEAGEIPGPDEGGDRAPDRVPPWDHLRARRFAPNAPLNELRLADYRAAFERAFPGAVLLEDERHDVREHLTAPVRAEIAARGDWSEHELLVDRLMVLARKEG